MEYSDDDIKMKRSYKRKYDDISSDDENDDADDDAFQYIFGLLKPHYDVKLEEKAENFMKGGMSIGSAKKKAYRLMNAKYETAFKNAYKQFLHAFYLMNKSPLHKDIWRDIRESQNYRKRLYRAINTAVKEHEDELVDVLERNVNMDIDKNEDETESNDDDDEGNDGDDEVDGSEESSGEEEEEEETEEEETDEEGD
jgi:hypothetical protein